MIKQMDSIGVKLLNELLDRYERSRSFAGANKVNQHFTVRVADVFPKYADEAQYDYYMKINAVLEDMEDAGFIRINRLKNECVSKCSLNVVRLEDIYKTIDRTSKRSDYDWILEKFTEMEEKYPDDLLLRAYMEEQKLHMKKGGNIAFFNGERQDFEDILTAVRSVLLNTSETYIRDFSVKIFHDSKRMEKLKNAVQGILYQFGDFEEKEYVLEECGIVNTPTYVSVKGAGRLVFAGQVLDLARMQGDIALSTESLKGLERVKVCGKQVITVENMTSFHDYDAKDAFVIYLGGFHNRIKCEFILKLYKENPNIQYLHFGDIDAGGFYIYEHLCRKTGIPFGMLNMDIAVLNAHRAEWNCLTLNDTKRLKNLIQLLDEKNERKEKFCDYRDTISFMIRNNCKIEQEQLLQ